MTPDAEARPLISVVIPTCSADRFLPDCLRSLQRQSMADFEAIVVDNGSTDEAAAALTAEFPWVRMIRLPGRQGFSKPVNAGCGAAEADLVFVLNDDTVLEDECLQELLAAAQAHPEVSFFAALMVYYDAPETVNSAAHALLSWGAAVDWGLGQPLSEEYLRPQPVFGACAGAALYRRALLQELGGFDETFHFLHEDVDLDFRAQLAGHTCWTVPTARVRHRVSQSLGADSPSAIEAGFRNAALVLGRPGSVDFRLPAAGALYSEVL
ncbi:MAG: glycosyltransferase family 2 protein [Armatimonadia bacterium]